MGYMGSLTEKPDYIITSGFRRFRPPNLQSEP